MFKDGIINTFCIGKSGEFLGLDDGGFGVININKNTYKIFKDESTCSGISLNGDIITFN